jgi:hypothetical protein
VQSKLRTKLIVGIVAVAALAGGGAAVAASQFGSEADEQAILNDAAKQLGVEPQELSDALEKAFEARIDEAVEAGRLTEEQGQRMKERLQEEGLPMFGHGHGHGPHHGPGLDAAAAYLGLSEAELRAELEGGKTLAEIAADQGKSVEGLKDAMLADAEDHLEAAVAAGRITEAQKQEILSRLTERIDDVVNGTFPGPGHHHGEGVPGDGDASAEEPASF